MFMWRYYLFKGEIENLPSFASVRDFSHMPVRMVFMRGSDTRLLHTTILLPLRKETVILRQG
jgi:hypothetical protein